MQHSKREHALLSASKAKQWINCPPSALMGDKVRQSTSTFAEEGTTAHEYAELLIRKTLNSDRPQIIQSGIQRIKESPYYNTAFDMFVQEYVTYVLNSMTYAKGIDANAFCITEGEVNFDNWVPEGFGTADFVGIYGRKAEVTDLKFGKGIPVYAENNPQLMLYALGVYQTYKQYVDFDRFKLTIHQPRLETVSTWETTLSELLHWAETVVVPAANLAIRGEGELNAGEWCRFCPMRSSCPKLSQSFSDFSNLAQGEVTMLSEDELNSVLKIVLAEGDNVIRWIKSVKELALQKVVHGEEIEGYKLVRGRSARKYSNPAMIANMLEQAGFSTEQIYNFDIKPLTYIEKLVGRNTFKECFGEYVEKPEGMPTLVPLDDSRVSIGDDQSILNDFKNLDDYGGFSNLD